MAVAAAGGRDSASGEGEDGSDENDGRSADNTGVGAGAEEESVAAGQGAEGARERQRCKGRFLLLWCCRGACKRGVQGCLVEGLG